MKLWGIVHCGECELWMEFQRGSIICTKKNYNESLFCHPATVLALSDTFVPQPAALAEDEDLARMTTLKAAAQRLGGS